MAAQGEKSSIILKAAAQTYQSLKGKENEKDVEKDDESETSEEDDDDDIDVEDDKHPDDLPVESDFRIHSKTQAQKIEISESGQVFKGDEELEIKSEDLDKFPSNREMADVIEEADKYLSSEEREAFDVPAGELDDQMGATIMSQMDSFSTQLNTVRTTIIDIQKAQTQQESQLHRIKSVADAVKTVDVDYLNKQIADMKDAIKTFTDSFELQLNTMNTFYVGEINTLRATISKLAKAPSQGLPVAAQGGAPTVVSTPGSPALTPIVQPTLTVPVNPAASSASTAGQRKRMPKTL